MPYLTVGDLLYESDEIQRWNAIDSNLSGIAKTSGDMEYGGGILSGWAVSIVSDVEKTVYVTAGSGLINGVKVSAGEATITGLNPMEVYTIYAESYYIPSISAYPWGATILATQSEFIDLDGRVELAKIHSY